ncbi:transposase [Bradyrhizobium sp. 1.29L]
MEGHQCRLFTENHERQDVELVVSSRRSIGSIAKKLGLRDSVLRRWVDKFRQSRHRRRCAHHAGDADVGGRGFGDRPLRQENERLRLERHLKKSSVKKPN